MATLRLFGLLRKAVAADRLETTAPTVGDALDEARARFGPAFSEHVFGPDGVLVPGVIVLVDGRNVLFQAGLATPLEPRTEVHVFPPSSGG